ncbi:acyl-CoA dehydrogenase [Actinoplanes ianthinogenes]|uniref:Dibenzothiophene monooxygenase n=1 Tax=Actinoplanes ianthinogenes TaxID=122358 RepID=A0ABM7M7Q4_9ACTN|nr:acyl-CoA dehydrogenase family protein [Actinoplanes ianthinogenes]BCJ47671.1 acyl-CoA dehydrogenase [Actinoplanes ianthinogenes]GGR03353.1 acyl-CoA dehydrogenase [Actinoplanes ianthinogenes]
MPTDLVTRFRPLLDRIAADAREREATRRLPLDEARELAALGLGAVRVPQEFGGSGASLRQLFELLVELGAAESNLVQAFRVHFRFTEDRWEERDTDRGRRWLSRIGAGAVVGNATSERSGNVRGRTTTTLTEAGGRLVLDGTKYYSTGSLYADWISVAVVGDDGNRITALVPRDAPGLQLLDDYTGFGQRMSGSGTTILTGVPVDPEDVIPQRQRHAGTTSIVQLVHLATLAGIARRAVDEAADFVRRRRRSYGHGSADLPAEDPLVQQVLGRVDAIAHTSRQIVLAVADDLDTAKNARWALHDAASPDREEQVRELEQRAELSVLRAQSVVIDQVLHATTEIFEVGGASAVEENLRLDRHWRNARVLSSHNPAIYRERQIGEHLLTGVLPVSIPSVGVAPSLLEAAQ